MYLLLAYELQSTKVSSFNCISTEQSWRNCGSQNIMTLQDFNKLYFTMKYSIQSQRWQLNLAQTLDEIPVKFNQSFRWPLVVSHNLSSLANGTLTLTSRWTT